MIPETLSCCIDIVPKVVIPVNWDPSPLKEVAVTIPDTSTSPTTDNLEVGFVDPIPILPET